MADKSSIEWTDATWNIVTGCSRVSAGCERCYAERLAATRLKHHPSRQGLTDGHGRWNGEIRFNEQWLAQSLRWRRPRRIFVAAHGDLFHENVPVDWLDRIFAVMALCPRHDFQILTKRPERMRAYLRDSLVANRIHGVIYSWLLHGKPGPAGFRFSREVRWRAAARADRWQPQFDWPLPNAWIGVSAEDQPTADKRISVLRQIPAALRWLSAEPLLGPMAIDDHLARLDWVVAGGESGPGARPMDPAWVRSLRNQCICARVPYFFKQWGGTTAKAGGCELDGRTWRQMPNSEAPR